MLLHLSALIALMRGLSLSPPRCPCPVFCLYLSVEACLSPSLPFAVFALRLVGCDNVCCSSLVLSITAGSRRFPAVNSQSIYVFFGLVNSKKKNQNMQALASPQPPDLLLADIHQLRQVGMHRLQDIMSSTGRTVLTKRQLMLKLDKDITARTLTAFKRIAYMLTLPPGITKETYCSRPPVQAGHGATIHPEYARLLKFHNLSDDIDIRNAPLPALWAAQTHAPSTEQALTEIQAYLSSLSAPPRGHTKSSSVRQTATDITAPLVYRIETGYHVYQRIKDEKRQPFKDFFFGIYKTKRYRDTLGVHSWEPPGTSRYAQHQR